MHEDSISDVGEINHASDVPSAAPSSAINAANADAHPVGGAEIKHKVKPQRSAILAPALLGAFLGILACAPGGYYLWRELQSHTQALSRLKESQSALQERLIRAERGASTQTNHAPAVSEDRMKALETSIDEAKNRLNQTEDQLSRAKTDMRASVAPRDSGPANMGSAAAQLVLVQDLITNIKNDGPFASDIAALRASGADQTLIKSLSEQESAPSRTNLRRAFSSLRPQLIAAVSPAAAPPPRDYGEAVWQRISGLIRVQTPKSAEFRQFFSSLDQMDGLLESDDVAQALALRAQWPQAAQNVSADWAVSARRRMDLQKTAKSLMTELIGSMAQP